MNVRPTLPFLAAFLATPLAAQHRAPDFSRPVWRSPVEFTSLLSFRELPDGRLIVPDPQDGEIRLLDAHGRSLGTIGRRGGGPQEFRRPIWALMSPGDSTLISDRDQERFLLIGPDAAPVRTIPWPRIDGSGLHNRLESDGTDRIFFTQDGLPRPGVTNTPLLRWDRLTGRIDTLTTIAAPEVVRYTATFQGHESYVTRALPFREGDAWAVGSRGEVAIVHPDTYVVEWFFPDGRHLVGAPIPFDRRSIGPADRAPFLDGENPAAVGHLTFPEYKPAVSSFIVKIAPGGILWALRLGAAGDSAVTFDRIDATGRRIDTVRLPPRRMLMGFGRELLYLAYTDENDLQHLEAYR